MNIDEIFAEIDRLYSEHEIEKVEEYMLDRLGEAARQNDENVMIQLLNELIGHYRETGDFDRMVTFAGKLLDILENSSLKGSMAHATSLLNVANAYRACGMLRESNTLYQQVKSYYDENVSPDSMLYASLLNNMSLLFQEMGDHESAADCLERALGISLLHDECRIEQATTYTNLATTLIKLDRYDEAEIHLEKAFELFEKDDDPDYHYSAALSAMAEIKYHRKDYAGAAEYYQKALDRIELSVGRSKAYEITKQNLDAVLEKMESEGPRTGLELSRMFYEEFGRQMIHEKFPEYEDRIAAGLVGEGSECFGFDDEISTDHDFGPGFCIWLTKKDYKKIGKKMQKEYDKLPKEYRGFRRLETKNAGKRVGVFRIDKFYENLLGIKGVPEDATTWLGIEDERFAHAVNGEVFEDGPGVFSAVRNELLKYYPDNVWRRKIARCASLMSQTGQYNYPRMLQRGDIVTATVCRAEFIKQTMQMLYFLNKQYAPYYKWMYRGLSKLPGTERIANELDMLAKSAPEEGLAQDFVKSICREVLQMLRDLDLTKGDYDYLDHHAMQIVFGKDSDKATSENAPSKKEILIDKLIDLEWKAFDKVINEGGRAGCQDDHKTFYIMRKSQYMLWSREMLESFIADFEDANSHGWNLITEKYGRMEESTAPEEYEKIKDQLPPVSDEKKKIIEAIVGIQVKMMEEFATQYPKASCETRSIHTSEDTPVNTSYETYLRGELSTYSDNTLMLYGRFVAEYANAGRNIAFETIGNSAILYGYSSLEDMESKL
ncbi:MAG: DUF4125 family protein [Lachnospiraceae bacterium]|nr:DUF4125 family protein [Lachnospiraceae bacterium]